MSVLILLVRYRKFVMAFTIGVILTTSLSFCVFKFYQASVMTKMTKPVYYRGNVQGLSDISGIELNRVVSNTGDPLLDYLNAKGGAVD